MGVKLLLVYSICVLKLVLFHSCDLDGLIFMSNILLVQVGFLNAILCVLLDMFFHLKVNLLPMIQSEAHILQRLVS